MLQFLIFSLFYGSTDKTAAIAPMLQRRTLFSVLFHFLSISASTAFLPHFSPWDLREVHSLNLLQSPIEKAPITLQPVQPIQKERLRAIHSHIVDSKKNRLSPRDREFRWLNWLYHQWKNTPIGKLDASILRQFEPALSSYARRETRKTAKQAGELLERYILEYKAGNPHAVLKVALFNTAMTAHAKIGQPERAQAILKRMIALSREDHNLSHLQPDVFSLTTVATAWAKSRRPEASAKAERFLQYMERHDMEPNTVMYNVILSAIARGSDPNKAVRAEALVKRMQQRHKSGQDCEPCLYSYQTLMAAISRTRQQGMVDIVKTILDYLDEQTAMGKTELEPNAHCFAAAIHAWAYSKEPSKARHAYLLLQDMRDRYENENKQQCKPNVVVFTAVINACVKPASEEEKDAAFGIAQLVWEELLYSSYGPPNFLTYATFLHAVATTLDYGDRRDEVVGRIFADCCKRGCVGQIVLDKLQEAASPFLYRDLLEGIGQELPPSWTRRVKGERRDSMDRGETPHSGPQRFSIIQS